MVLKFGNLVFDHLELGLRLLCCLALLSITLRLDLMGLCM